MQFPPAFQRFPKKRSTLPPEYAAIYEQHYRMNREGGSAATSVAQRMERWMHHQVAADVRDGQVKSTLELGAGTLNHLPYEPRCAPYDIVEPFESLFRKSTHLERIRAIYSDINDIPPGTTYDRITAIATFEHVLALPDVVAKSGLLLNQGGCLRIAIPSEGTLLWTLGWNCTTGVEFRLKHGLDYGVLMRHEHVNTASEIETVLRSFFRSVLGSALGLCNALSFYQAFVCSDPDIALCEAWMEQAKSRREEDPAAGNAH